jgi:hypothetical protein
MPAAALEAEVNNYTVELDDQRDSGGHRLVVRNAAGPAMVFKLGEPAQARWLAA